MITTLLQQLGRRASRRIATHPAVCPPALFMDTQPLWQHQVRRWLGRNDGSFAVAMARLAEVQGEFSEQLLDVPQAQAATTLERIARARSMLELWHLRAEVFDLVARHHSQDLAQRRLALLNRHYPTRSPRSGFAPLTG